MESNQTQQILKSKPNKRLRKDELVHEPLDDNGWDGAEGVLPTAPTEIIVTITGLKEGEESAESFHAEIALNSLTNMFNRACSTRIKEHVNILATAYGLSKGVYQLEGDEYIVSLRRVYKVPPEEGREVYSYPPLPKNEFEPVKGVGPTRSLNLMDCRRLQVRSYGSNSLDYSFVVVVYDDVNLVLMDNKSQCIYLRRDAVFVAF